MMSIRSLQTLKFLSLTLHFKANRGTTQGGIISTLLFNLIVDNVIWKCLALMVEYQLV